MAIKKDRKRAVSVPGFYTCEQAAKRLNMKPDTVRRYVHRGLIKAGILGDVYVITQENLDRFASERREPGRPAARQMA